MNNNVLKKFGLTEKEIQLYLKLLELGSATSGDLMKELKFYSKTIYELLNKLIDKGLVSFVIKSNTKYFEAENPEKFFEIISEEEKELEERKKEIGELIPELISKRETKKALQEATIYKGKKGMKSIFENILKQKSEVLTFGGGGKFRQFFGDYFYLWNKKMAKAKIRQKLLLDEKSKNNKEIHKLKLYSVRFLPKEFDNPAPAVIYEDKVAITIWSEEPIAILIRSPEVAKIYRSYFNLLWKIAKT